MNLLAISWEMPPLSGPRAVQVTRTLTALAELGWRSRVVCFGPQSNRYQQDYDVPVEQDTGGAVRRLPVPSPEEWFLFRALWRVCPPLKHQPDEKRVWVRGALAEARRAVASDRPDVLVSFAQPWSDHLVGLALHRETGIPWVAHFSDPWIDSPYQSRSAWARRTAAGFEREVVGEATRVVFVNDYTEGRVMAKYPSDWRSRSRVVTQGFEPAPAAPSHKRVAGGPLRIVYTGRFYDGIRTPDALLAALVTLRRERALDDQLTVEFVGGAMESYDRKASALGLSSIVQFTGRLDPDRARARAAAADVLLIVDAPADGPSLFLPSKLVDYLPLGRPILGLTPEEGPSADLLRELGYLVVNPRRTADIARVLAELLDAHQAGTLRSSPQHAEVSAPYDIRVTTRAFGRVLDEARGGR